MEEHTNDIPSTNGVMIPHVLKNEKAMFTFLQPGELFPHIALPLTVIFIDIFHCYSWNHYYSKQFEIDLHCHTPFHMHQHTHTMLHTIFLTHNIYLNSRAASIQLRQIQILIDTFVYSAKCDKIVTVRHTPHTCPWEPRILTSSSNHKHNNNTLIQQYAYQQLQSYHIYLCVWKAWNEQNWHF